jgi:hypothetical protein
MISNCQDTYGIGKGIGDERGDARACECPGLQFFCLGIACTVHVNERRIHLLYHSIRFLVYHVWP